MRQYPLFSICFRCFQRRGEPFTLQLINMERANAGVSAVTIGSQNLNDAAQGSCTELTSRYSYVRPNGQREFTILSEYGVTDASVGEAYWAGTETPGRNRCSLDEQ